MSFAEPQSRAAGATLPTHAPRTPLVSQAAEPTLQLPTAGPPHGWLVPGVQGHFSEGLPVHASSFSGVQVVTAWGPTAPLQAETVPSGLQLFVPSLQSPTGVAVGNERGGAVLGLGARLVVTGEELGILVVTVVAGRDGDPVLGAAFGGGMAVLVLVLGLVEAVSTDARDLGAGGRLRVEGRAILRELARDARGDGPTPPSGRVSCSST